MVSEPSSPSSQTLSSASSSWMSYSGFGLPVEPSMGSNYSLPKFAISTGPSLWPKPS
jgi:hypothetical protein